MIKFTFYLFALILVAAATGVITVRNPVHAVLFLVLAFFSSAAIWLLLHAEFLAIALIIVYVGAVMVLFLFVVMMLDIHFVRLKEGFIRYFPWAAAVGAIILLEMILVIKTFSISQVQSSSEATLPNTHLLGQILYTKYVYPFEIAAVILLVAMIAAIALTMRPRRQKMQQPAQQTRVQREARVRLVNLPSQPKE
jgi:NADH-quinone oxidoreductase subunit J